MHRRLEAWPVGRSRTGPASDLVAAVGAALAGTGPALAPVTGPVDPTEIPAEVPAEVALAVRTSGSTGRPRRVLLGSTALRASAERTHERLGGPGRWLLSLPLDHVAGLQVLVRSVVAGTTPEPTGPAPEAIASAVRPARDRGTSGAPPAGGRLYAAVVPTQLHRAVQAARGGRLPPELRALTELDAILVGGAGAAPALLAAAADLGLRVVTTYGMTETCGGCVYDGVPLADVRIELAAGVVRLAGPVLAEGYLLDGELVEEGFERDAAGTRWFRTADLGRLDGGRLTVLGRRDEVIVTGGLNVVPAAVEAALAGDEGVDEVCVVGVPDPEWGHRVVAVVVPRPGGTPDLVGLRERVGRTLGTASAPRGLVLVDSLPVRGPGKVDRAAVARLALRAAPGDAPRP